MRKNLLLPIVILGFGLILILMSWPMVVGAAQAAPTATTRYVAPGGNCGGVSPCYADVQAAVDAAQSGDTIKVAEGTYSGVQTRVHWGNTVTQTVFLSKTVTIRGGYTTSNWNTPDPDAHFTTLDAQGKGRVFYIAGYGITPVLDGLRITGGDAQDIPSGSSSGVGGGVYVQDAEAQITNCEIYDNQEPSGSGGGLYVLWSEARISNSTIRNNSAFDYGGGVAVVPNSGQAPVVEKNTIEQNRVDYNGGGLALFGDSIIARNNTIANNQANFGGGVWIGGDAELTGNLIRNNRAAYGGGVNVSRGSPRLTNNAIIANEGTSAGAGVYVTGSDTGTYPHLAHTTIANNTGGQYGDGSGVCVTDDPYGAGYHGAVDLTNSIIAGHSLGITVTANNTAVLNATLWHNNATDRGGAGSITHQNDYSGDPYFASDGYHLLGRPGALDRGVNAGVTTDIDGDQRPIGSGYDLGADETARKFFIYLPLVLRNH